jgi:molybdenum cofactor cytidylyltransferase
MTPAPPSQTRPDAEGAVSRCQSGLILAAGEGRRFGGEGKLLAELDGRPLLEHAIRAQTALAELRRIVVVLGARAELLLERIDFDRAEPVVCPDWADGQAASLRCGVAALRDAERVIVTLGDQPLITPALIRRFLEAPDGARATYGGRPGHPVVLGPCHLAAIPALHGDRGAAKLLDGPLIECGETRAGADVDTKEDLEAVRDEARAVI